MTVSVVITRGENHAGPVYVQRDRWVECQDDGSKHVPAHWAPDEVLEVPAGESRQFLIEPGVGMKIWEDAADRNEAG